jgi:hypothetical protein
MVTRKKIEPDMARLDRVVADARRAREERDRSYRGQALKLYPWICGRCAREFDNSNLHELTVHHKDHNHDHNPPDGSNWELLCLYCHDNEHQRQLEAAGRQLTGSNSSETPGATHTPFEALAALMRPADDPSKD